MQHHAHMVRPHRAAVRAGALQLPTTQLPLLLTAAAVVRAGTACAAGPTVGAGAFVVHELHSTQAVQCVLVRQLLHFCIIPIQAYVQVESCPYVCTGLTVQKHESIEGPLEHRRSAAAVSQQYDSSGTLGCCCALWAAAQV